MYPPPGFGNRTNVHAVILTVTKMIFYTFCLPGPFDIKHYIVPSQKLTTSDVKINTYVIENICRVTSI